MSGFVSFDFAPDFFRRVKILYVKPALAVEFLKPGRHSQSWDVTENPVPEDAVIVSSFYDKDSDLFGVVLASERFDVIDGQDEIPRLAPVVTQTVRAREAS